MSHKILVLNPGSTSTKAAVYEDEHPLMLKSIGAHQPGPVPLSCPSTTS